MKKEETAVIPEQEVVTPQETPAAVEETPIAEETAPPAATEAEPAPEALELDQLRRYKAEMEQANQVIMDVLDAEPVLAKIIQDISMGATFREAIARHIDPEDLVAQEGDPDFEAWEKNRAARGEELGKRKEMDEKLSANQEMTKAEIKAFAEEHNMTPEAAIEFLGKVDELFSNVYAGLIDRKALNLLKKAIDADQMVAEAKEEGIIEGRNTKIKETVVPQKVGDGLPKLSGTDNVQTPAPPKKKRNYVERLMNPDEDES